MMSTTSITFLIVTIILALYAVWNRYKAKKYKINDGYVLIGMLSCVFAAIFCTFFIMTLV